MSRLAFSFAFAFCLSVLSFSTVGCGSDDNTVIEDTRSDAEIAQEEEEYEEMMNSVEEVDE